MLACSNEIKQNLKRHYDRTITQDDTDKLDKSYEISDMAFLEDNNWLWNC